MQINALPPLDTSVNTTGCCPKFNPEGWDGVELHFRDKPFLRAKTRSLAHIPLNMGRVFSRVQHAMEAAGATDMSDYIVLSRDPSPFAGEHLFATSKPVEGEEMTTLSGDFVTKVFEGPYSKMGDWSQEMHDIARERGATPGDVWFFYTTCPKCAKAYGQNYVVGIAAI